MSIHQYVIDLPLYIQLFVIVGCAFVFVIGWMIWVAECDDTKFIKAWKNRVDKDLADVKKAYKDDARRMQYGYVLRRHMKELKDETGSLESLGLMHYRYRVIMQYLVSRSIELIN